MKPVRIQLSRRKGFNLQAASLALNGLPAVKVDRTSKFGNPYRIGDHDPITAAPMTWEMAVRRHREWLESALSKTAPRGGRREVEYHFAVRLVDAIRRELAGKNLACWCPIGSPCHADVLLELANRPT